VLAQLVRQLQAPQANPTVAEFLRSLPSGCTWAGQGPAAMLPGPLFDGVRASLGDLGTQRTILRRRDDGFEVEQRVAAADVLRITSAVVTVAGAQLAGIVGELPAAGSTDDGAGVEPDVVALLRQAEDLGPTNSSVTALSGLLEHPQPKVAARAAWLLGEWRARTAIEALGVTATRYPEPSVRVQAMAALARIVDPAVAPAATAAATDGDRRVRTLAVQALGRLGPELALKPVLGLLDAHGS
jgi:hypothetical protein